MSGADEPDPVAAARARAKSLTDLYWHLGAFVIVNAFLWLIDLTLGDPGADWAFWITATWGLALAFHVLAYLIGGRQVEERAARRYLLEQELEQEGDEGRGGDHR